MNVKVEYIVSSLISRRRISQSREVSLGVKLSRRDVPARERASVDITAEWALYSRGRAYFHSAVRRNLKFKRIPEY